MKDEQKFIDFCLSRLAAEGIEAFTEMELKDGEEVDLRIRVPAWECDNEEKTLCRDAIYAFIHSKLAGQPYKGFSAAAPGLAEVDVYAYHPTAIDAGETLSQLHLGVWGIGAKLELFEWTEMVEGDDSAWWDGWEFPGNLHFISQRLTNLAAVLNFTIVDLPAVSPLTRLELVDRLKAQGPLDSITCLSPDHNDQWCLRLNAEGELHLHKKIDGSSILIGDEHFDDKGRLVLDGFVTMHRVHGF